MRGHFQLFRLVPAERALAEHAPLAPRYAYEMMGRATQLVALDWGSVPDWLAAVGTVGAFAATLLILGLDRRRSRRAAAVSLAVWATRSFRSAADGDSQTVTVHAYNGASGPVPVANVVSNRNGSDYVNEILTANDRGFSELSPGGRISIEFDVVHHVDDAHLFVFFVDSFGRQWAKRVSDGRLFRPARGRRLAGIEGAR